MTDRPIIFSAPMVRALIEGRKTQTRRVLKPQPDGDVIHHGCDRDDGPFWSDQSFASHPLRFWAGDLLWVREAWSHAGVGVWTIAAARAAGRGGAMYRADHDVPGAYWPSIHMPREFSRLTLTVTEVRVERLQDISEADAMAEGVVAMDGQIAGCFAVPGAAAMSGTTATDCFARLWNSLHGPDAWAANPWVVVLSFTVEHRNIDAEP